MNIEIEGVSYEARPLTMGQVRSIQKMPADAADVAAVQWSTGAPGDAVKRWFDSVPAGRIQKAIQVVFEISELTEGAGFQG